MPENFKLADILLSQSTEYAEVIRFVGNWQGSKLSEVIDKIEELANKSAPLIINLSEIEKIDTIGAGLIIRLMNNRKGQVQLQGANPYVEKLITTISSKWGNSQIKLPERTSLLEKIFIAIGKTLSERASDFLSAMYILGSVISSYRKIKFHHYKKSISLSPIINHINYIGVHGIPVIVFMSFLTGSIIVQQGAFQLRYFGAEIYAIDLISILQLREIGVLLTAIMVAGRSGSAITAEIGSMKMREETDALKVMRLSYIKLLVSPRLIALAVSLPLLTILANFSAILGAAIVVRYYSGITFPIFFSRLHAAVTISNIFVGLIKSPFMALSIGIVATVGLKVKSSAESLGKQVTFSVVKSISAVIIIDALFAIFYSKIGI